MFTRFVSPVFCVAIVVRIWFGPSSTPSVVLVFVTVVAACQILISAIGTKIGSLVTYKVERTRSVIVVERRVSKTLRLLIALAMACLLTWWTAT